MILCKKCGSMKDCSEFKPDVRYKRGYTSWCHSCHRARNSSWAKENKERLNQKAGEWRAANRGKARKSNALCKRKHAQKYKQAHAEWAKRNREKRNATCAKHKAAKLRAMPSWADAGAIEEIYKHAKEMQGQSGQRIHVDHIVPLQHPLVCGLHVPANLRAIPASENESKRNFWWPDMASPIPHIQPDLLEGDA